MTRMSDERLAEWVAGKGNWGTSAGELLDALIAERKYSEWLKGNPMSDDEYELFRKRFPRFMLRLQSAEKVCRAAGLAVMEAFENGSDYNEIHELWDALAEWEASR